MFHSHAPGGRAGVRARQGEGALMPGGGLTFSGLDWRWPVCVLVLAAAVAAWWSWRGAPMGAWRRRCVFLKALAVCALGFCLLEPLWSGQRARPGANLFAVAADNSMGMLLKDPGALQTRADQMSALLRGPGAGWMAGLESHFDVRRFTFDSRLQASSDFGELRFSGNATAIGAAIRGLQERFKGRPLAGVLLFTDGNATDLAAIPASLTNGPPIYPVIIGREGSARDLAVTMAQVTETSFEDAPAIVRVGARADGFAGERVTATLMDANGRAVAEKSQRVEKSADVLDFRFQFKPDRPGVSLYRVRLAGPGSGTNVTDANAVTSEATLLNNERSLAVDRGRGPYRILYVAGRPNWEFKFLNRALQQDDQVHLVALMRVAQREPKFDFRGRSGESSNPLFRGFGDQSREEAQRYDQPVLVRLNTRDELELRAGFPKTEEDLYGYSAVVLDDLEAGFFTADQAALLRRFVADRGGGFMMLGGMECFREGGYARTPIGEMLPVYLDRGGAVPAEGAWKWDLGREGWLEPWARLRDNENDEKARLKSMPNFEVVNRVADIKPAASVVVRLLDERGGEHPGLVTQRFGRGRAAALLIGDVWRWGMKDQDARADMEKAWRQMMRWLVADVPKRVELSLEHPSGEEPGTTTLLVRARDAKYQPLDDADVTIEVVPSISGGQGAGTNTVRIKAEPSPAEAGLYVASYLARAAGGYVATAVVTNSAGVSVGAAEAGWASDPGADEFRSLQPNLALMETLARKTGGEVIAAGDLDRFVRGLPERRAPVMEPWATPAWHTPWLFLLALACFASEWGVRRWKGLP